MAVSKVKAGPGRAVTEPGPHGLSIGMKTYKSSFLDSSHYLSGLGQGFGEAVVAWTCPEFCCT